MNPLQIFNSPLTRAYPRATAIETAQASQRARYEQIIQAQMRQSMFPPSGMATATSSYMPFQPAIATAFGGYGREDLRDAVTSLNPYGPFTEPPRPNPKPQTPVLEKTIQFYETSPELAHKNLYSRPEPPKEEKTVPVNIKESLKGFMSEKLDREDVVKLGLLALVLWWLLRSPRFDGARGEVGGWLKERIGSLLDGGKNEEAK